MLVTHEFQVRALCPVNDLLDHYTVRLTVREIVPVEEILTFVDTLIEIREYQENITQRIASRFNGTAVSVGTHSGVTTTCECP